VSSEITDDYMPHGAVRGVEGWTRHVQPDDGPRVEGRQHPCQPLRRGFCRRDRIRRYSLRRGRGRVAGMGRQRLPDAPRVPVWIPTGWRRRSSSPSPAAAR
jgi:hypothetical protein